MGNNSWTDDSGMSNNSTSVYSNPLASEQWVKDVEVIYLFLIILVGIPGNVMILLVQRKNGQKTTTDYYVITMAAFELISSCLNTSLRIMVDTELLWNLIASSFSCSFRQFFNFLTTMSSAFLLAAIAIDRYIKTSKPHITVYTSDMARRVCIGLSVASFVCSVHTFGTYDIDIYYNCVLKKSTENVKKMVDLLNVSLTIVVYIITTLAYINISLTLRKRHRVRVAAKLNTKPSTVSTGKASTISLFNIHKVAPAPSSSPLVEEEKSIKDPASRKTSPKLDVGNNESTSSRQGVQGVSGKAGNPSSDVNQCPNVQESLNKHTRHTIGPYSRANPHFRHIQLAITHSHAFQKLSRQEEILNRTTRIMFLISVVYIFCWLLSWLRVIFGQSGIGATLSHFARSFYLTTCIANPLFFFCMSSKFRDNAVKLLFCK